MAFHARTGSRAISATDCAKHCLTPTTTGAAARRRYIRRMPRNAGAFTW